MSKKVCEVINRVWRGAVLSIGCHRRFSEEPLMRSRRWRVEHSHTNSFVGYIDSYCLIPKMFMFELDRRFINNIQLCFLL